MERPSEEFRISTPVSIGIAIALCGVAAAFWSAIGKTEGYAALGSLTIAGACLLLAGLALWFARSRFVFWLGLAVVLVLASWKG
ncbi:MAG: hypothetical protein IPL06_22070 [Betaproteobacteria bacterium]|nr:hypothetical protein [Betaproteobacteria bacterium]